MSDRAPPASTPPPHFLLIPVWHFTDPFSRSSSYGGLGNLSTSAFGGLGNPSPGKRWPPLRLQPLSIWPLWPVTEQCRASVRPQGEPGGEEIKTLSSSFCVKTVPSSGRPKNLLHFIHKPRPQQSGFNLAALLPTGSLRAAVWWQFIN